MHRFAYPLAVLFFALVGTWFAIAQQPGLAQNVAPQRVPKWEYRALEMQLGRFDEGGANSLGDQGWELVATFTPTNRGAVSVVIFKRRK